MMYTRIESGHCPPKVSSEDKREDEEDDVKNLETSTGKLQCEVTSKCAVINCLKVILLLLLLYLFVCSLNVMGSAFTLIGGSTAGKAVFESEIMNNPVSGLMVGVIVTVLVQSSSTSTSLIVAMVAADLISVTQAIPMIMGANIGTSITNTIVSMGQVASPEQFRRAFAGATVHDCFNWLSVLVLLPLEVASNYLYLLTEAIIGHSNVEANEDFHVDFLNVITKPLTKLIIQLDKSLIAKIALGEIAETSKVSLVKRWCEKDDIMMNINVTNLVNGTNVTALSEVTNYTNYIKRCDHIFAHSDLNDTIIGIILLIISLLIMISSLISIVKLLQSMLRGGVDRIVKKMVNADFPGKLSFLTGYVAILVGACLTMLLQSSSIFTSTITPLVGLDVIKLERAYPLTLGANIGTTVTGLLAALANSDAKHFEHALQIALCHLFFNISGIIIWYPFPYMRKIPIEAAKKLGNITAKYRWFALMYLIFMFFLLPGSIFALSLAGWQWLVGVGVPIVLLIVLIIIMNVLQAKAPHRLPKTLRNWNFLPECMHSLEPLNRCVKNLSCLPRHRRKDAAKELPVDSVVDGRYQNSNGMMKDSGQNHVAGKERVITMLVTTV
ncbi:sodium-dependent phosphate transport protein 2B-like [Ptychodera flava]|uniref:sodium-dependent phosphate transport protein 2B-like n=1 Tax=Ptychodera flava TaxID=63121 RepID=UPI00396A0BA7